MTTEESDNGNGPAAPPEPTMPPKGEGGSPTYVYNYPPPIPPRHKSRLSNKPKVVGALLAIVAVLGLVMAALFGVGGVFFNNFEDWMPNEHGDPGTIMGQVTYLNGTGIPGATVSVVGKPISTVTDADGYYLLYNVPTGKQKIQVTAEGFTTVVQKVTISEFVFGPEWQTGTDYKRDLDFALNPGTGSVEIGSWVDDDMEGFTTMMAVCAAIIVVASLLALLGSFYAFKRTNVQFVVVGAVAGIFTLGFGLGSVLAFIALFILLLGMDEFRNGDTIEDAD